MSVQVLHFSRWSQLEFRSFPTWRVLTPLPLPFRPADIGGACTALRDRAADAFPSPKHLPSPPEILGRSEGDGHSSPLAPTAATSAEVTLAAPPPAALRACVLQPPGRPWAPDLPSPALHTLFTFLDGDTRTFCSASCVCRCWRMASLQPEFWRRLNLGAPSVGPSRPFSSVTGDTLRTLITRAGPELGAFIFF